MNRDSKSVLPVKNLLPTISDGGDFSKRKFTSKEWQIEYRKLWDKVCKFWGVQKQHAPYIPS